jgi:DnaJ-class molecular chaperone
LRIELRIDLASTLENQVKVIEVQTTNGHKETIEVQIPRGITSGTTIKYPGLGDNFFATLPRGDLHVGFVIMLHPQFRVDGIDLVTTSEIDCLSAITGCEIEVTGIDDRKFKVTIPAGIQYGVAVKIKDQGMWQLHGSARGNLIVKLNIGIPKDLTAQQLDLIKQIKQSL